MLANIYSKKLLFNLNVFGIININF